MKKKLISLALRSVFVALIVLGFVYDVNGAKNVAIFYVWFMTIFAFIGVFAVCTTTDQKIFKDTKRVFPMWFNGKICIRSDLRIQCK